MGGTMGARRVVTGHQAGKSVVVEDSEMDGFSFGALAVERLWASPVIPPPIPVDGSIDDSGPWFPPPGAIRSFRVMLPPDAASEPDSPVDAAFLAEVERNAPGALAHMEPDNPGMHVTRSVDIGIVQSGEVWLELDDGKEVQLRAGDYVIQNGTRHEWRNHGTQPSVMTFVVIGADPSAG